MSHPDDPFDPFDPFDRRELELELELETLLSTPKISPFVEITKAQFRCKVYLRFFLPQTPELGLTT